MTTDQITYPLYTVKARNGLVTLTGMNLHEGRGVSLRIHPKDNIATIRASNPEFPEGAWLQVEYLLDRINKVNLTGGYG